MDNDDFRRVWMMLDRDINVRCGGVGMGGLTAVGMIEVAERMRKELDQFCIEIVARFKHKAEMAKLDEQMMREKVGHAYDDIATEYAYGLDFNHKGSA